MRASNTLLANQLICLMVADGKQYYQRYDTLTLKVDTSSHEPVLQLAGANDDHILQQVRLTPEHPVYVLDRNGEELGWTITADLAPGDLIAYIDAR